MGKLIDLTGRRFGHLSVIKCAGRDKYKRGLWECRCDCGATVIVQSGNLRTNYTETRG